MEWAEIKLSAFLQRYYSLWGRSGVSNDAEEVKSLSLNSGWGDQDFCEHSKVCDESCFSALHFSPCEQGLLRSPAATSYLCNCKRKGTVEAYGGICYAKHQMAFYPNVLMAAEKVHHRKWLLPNYTRSSYTQERCEKALVEPRVKTCFICLFSHLLEAFIVILF